MNDKRSGNPNRLLQAAAVWLSVLSGVGLAADVTLQPRAVVSGGLVRLGDVAQVTGGDAATVDRLRRLPLMPAPAPGTHAVLAAGGVRELVTASGEDLDNLKFSGAVRVTIGDAASIDRASGSRASGDRAGGPAKPPRRTFAAPGTTGRAPKEERARPRQPTGYRRPSSSTKNAGAGARRYRSRTLPRALKKRLTAQLLERLSEFARREAGDPMLQALDAEIDDARLGRLSRATSGIRIAKTEPLVQGRQRFLVSFDTEEGPERLPVHAVVRPARPAVYAVRAIPRGATITRADVEARPMPVDARVNPNRPMFVSIDEVIGKEAASALRAGTPLDEGNCLPPLMVRRNAEVNVVAGGGGVRVRLQAKARSDGRLGEVVPVETYHNGERLMARVIGSGELAVLSAASPTYTASRSRSYR